MKDEPTIPIGIDLGTTYSVVARVNDRGRPTTVVNAEGERLTPSVVFFEGGETIVGREALKALANEPDHVAAWAKRDIGRQVYHKVVDGRAYPPEVLEAFILNKLRLDASGQLGKVAKAVITVPAYFDEVRRKATQDAGYMAGLTVLDIINEPTAAALAFGYESGLLDAEGAAPTPQRVMVYDLGGGTFDVTVMEIRGREYSALATDGDVELGGYDWDQRLADLVAEGFIREHFVDPREDPAAAARLWRDCEDAKRTLSSRPKATVLCEFQGKTSRVEIARPQFEEATSDLVDRTRFTAGETLKAAGLAWKDIDRVLLVGGSTRMPMVREMLTKLAGKTPDASIAADEAVAHGAALHAHWVLAKHAGRPVEFKVRNVNSHSLGVVGIDPETKRKRNGVLIPRNTHLPATARRTFRTHKDHQKAIVVQIVEGENAAAEECNPLGKCVIRGLPERLPAKSAVEILFHYQPNGRLKVKVSVPGADKEAKIEIERENTLSRENLDAWRRFIVGAPPA